MNWQKVKPTDPKRVSKLVDCGLALQAQVKELESQAEMIKKDLAALKDYLIESFTKDELREVRTAAGSAELVAREVPGADAEHGGWDAIFAYVQEHGAWDLLQKRLHERAVKDRLEQGEHVPGVKLTKIWNLKFTPEEK